MVDPDYSLLFNCPKCKAFGSIYLIKLAGNQMIIKQRCPTHGGRQFKIPLMGKDVVLPLFHSGVFRCHKCGKPASVDSKKVSGPWTIVKLNCPTHGNKLPSQKIWGTVYTEITLKEGEGPRSSESVESHPIEPVEKQPTPDPLKKFCPSCGSPLEGIETFCGVCGAEID